MEKELKKIANRNGDGIFVLTRRYVLCCFIKCLLTIISVCVFLSLLFLLAQGGEFFVKWIRGNAMVLTRAGFLEAVVNGRHMRLPYFRLDKVSLPEALKRDAADFMGVEDVVLCVSVNCDEVSAIYWFSESCVHVTRISFSSWCILDRWVGLSDTALHQTYDVRHDMKGHGANLSVHSKDGIKYYNWEFKKSKRNVSMSVRCPI